MIARVLICLVGMATAAAYNPYAQAMELAVVPVPNQVHSPTMMLACSNGMSSECEKIMDEIAKSSGPKISDEDWSTGQGYYENEFGDIDTDTADIGVLGMPYQVDYDLLQSHLIAISGVKPCGACDE